MTDLLDEDATEGTGDEWEEIDVTETEADRIAARQDRDFDAFRERIKDSEALKVEASVFDDATYAALYKLVQDGYLDAIGGPLSTGKEANVYLALAGERARAVVDAEDVALKVYRINASDFRDMRAYLEADPRFRDVRGDKTRIVLAWTRKEFANLQRAAAAGVRVPTPIAVERNALVMEFIGEDETRAKRLDEVEITNPAVALDVVREYMRRLYRAGLIHGDLSEYNVLVHRGELVVIDVGQAITTRHPNAEEFLRRDCENVANFFANQGADVDADALYAAVAASD
ncbi:MAG: RIO1 family regulatory kinase/ATPase [Halobacteriales archaeon]